MSDFIATLPVDEHPMTQDEKHFLSQVLQETSSTLTIKSFISELRIPLIVGILFLILGMPQVSEFIRASVPYARSSDSSLLIFKTGLIIVLIFVIINFSLTRS